MARIRSIHPGQWTDEDFVSVSLAARLLCIALRCEADDNGIFEWKPLMLKMRLMPADNVDVGALLAELAAANQVRQFEVEGKRFGAIRNFCRFQRPKKPNSIFPVPDDVGIYVCISERGSGSDGGDDDDVPNHGGNGKGSGARKGKPKSPSSPQGSPPVPNRFSTGSEPVPQKGEIAPQMKEEEEREEEKSPPAAIPDFPAPETAIEPKNAGKPAAPAGPKPPPGPIKPEMAGPVAVIQALDAAIVEHWGPGRARPWPHASDTVTAQRWLALPGCSVELVADLIAKQCATMTEKGKDPPFSLAFFRGDVERAAAEAKARADDMPDPEYDRWLPKMMRAKAGGGPGSEGPAPGLPGSPVPPRVWERFLSSGQGNPDRANGAAKPIRASLDAMKPNSAIPTAPTKPDRIRRPSGGQIGQALVT